MSVFKTFVFELGEDMVNQPFGLLILFYTRIYLDCICHRPTNLQGNTVCTMHKHFLNIISKIGQCILNHCGINKHL